MDNVRAIALTLATGCGINALIFLVAVRFGHLGPSVTAKATGAPLTWLPVVVATVVGAAAAMAARLVLARILRSARRARRVALVLAGLVLLVSLLSPVQGLAGATGTDVLLLAVMHVVAAVTAVMAAEWAARPAWTFGRDPYEERSVEPRVAVVTGATSGIGASVALALAGRGFRVFGVGRSGVRARQMETAHPNITILTGDLASMRDVQRLAVLLSAATGPAGIGVVIHCAGTLMPRSVSTAEGVDVNFATSFLGRFALTALLPLAPDCRIVNVSAAQHGHVPVSMRSDLARSEDIGHGMRAHGQAQLANDLWVAGLARLGVSAYGYGPGAVDTAIRRELPAAVRLMLRPVFAVDTRTPHEAALDIVRLVLDRALPRSGFASRDGLFRHDVFIEDAQRQDALLHLARAIVESSSGAHAPAAH